MLGFFQLLAGPPEAALPLAIPVDRRVELPGVEVRPQRRSEVKLGVGELPKQEIADALLAAGADEQIGLGRVIEREIRSQLILRKAVLGQRPAANQLRQRLHQVPAPAVVGGDGERKTRIGRGQLLGPARELDDPRPERRDIADDLQPHLVPVQAFGLLLQGGHEQLLERRNLFGRPAPVLRAERKQGKVFDAALAARARDPAHRLDALLVTRHARQIALLGPAPVAVHDDGDVPGNFARLRDLARGAGKGFHRCGFL